MAKGSTMDHVLPFATRISWQVILAGCLLAGCGGSPTAPSPAPPPMGGSGITNNDPVHDPWDSPPIPIVSGAWTGTLALTTPAVDAQPPRRIQVAVRVTLQQTDDRVTGLWLITTPDNDARGTIAGRLQLIGAGANFEGTLTWDSAAEGTSPPRCVGQTGVSGPSTPTALTWRAPLIDFGGTCLTPTELVWALRR